MISKRFSKGFTLIELLVVISIIGLLSSVVLAFVGDSRAKARDARRRSDLRQLVNAVELYYSKYNVYPVTDGWLDIIEGTSSPIYSALVPEFLPSMPVDPKYVPGSNTYQYWRKDNQVMAPPGVLCIAASSNTGKYAFYAQLEKPTASEIASFPNRDAFDTCIKLGWPSMTLKAGN